MKKQLAIAYTIAALGLSTVFGANYVSSQQTASLSEKAEKVDKHLKQQALGLGAVIFGDMDNADDVRSCLIFELSDFDDNKTEAILTGVSHKGDIFYLLSGKSEVEFIDYKSNGYGSVDEIFISYGENNAIQITSPTKGQLETANKIYEIILDGYYKEVISAEKTEEYENSLKPYVKASGDSLDKLIEELKSSEKIN